jgi:hypothetical protein
MSYNVLADELAQTHAQELYPRTPRHLLAWGRRWGLALQEIRHCDPDVLCLQVGHRPGSRAPRGWLGARAAPAPPCRPAQAP